MEGVRRRRNTPTLCIRHSLSHGSPCEKESFARSNERCPLTSSNLRNKTSNEQNQNVMIQTVALILNLQGEHQLKHRRLTKKCKICNTKVFILFPTFHKHQLCIRKRKRCPESYKKFEKYTKGSRRRQIGTGALFSILIILRGMVESLLRTVKAANKAPLERNAPQTEPQLQ